LDICEALLAAHADPTISNDEKNLPLHYLARRVVIPAEPKKKGKERRNILGLRREK